MGDTLFLQRGVYITFKVKKAIMAEKALYNDFGWKIGAEKRVFLCPF